MVVRTAVKWNCSRLKVQWKFLTKAQRKRIKLELGAGVPLIAASASALGFADAGLGVAAAGIFTGAVLMVLAHAEFFDHTSPKLLTAEELEEGTE